MKVFNFENLRDYDLYHLRYGKGAVIVAVLKEDSDMSRQKWDEIQEQRYRQSRDDTKPLREKISVLEKSRRHSGKREEIHEKNRPVDDEITAIQNEIRSLDYLKKSYFSSLQIARFYCHDLPRNSEAATRFDKITSINETATHLVINLEFSDRSNHQNPCHKEMGFSTDERDYPIEGRVTRLVPIEHVTLEIMARKLPAC